MGARFSAPVQTGPGAHTASYTMGTVSFPGVKRPWRGADHPPSSAEVEERVELYLYSPSGPSWPVLGVLTFYLHTRVPGTHSSTLFNPCILIELDSSIKTPANTLYMYIHIHRYSLTLLLRISASFLLR